MNKTEEIFPGDQSRQFGLRESCYGTKRLVSREVDFVP